MKLKASRSIADSRLNLKIGDEVFAVVSERPEEDRLSSLFKEKQCVEHLEQIRGRLMDGADHRALRGCDLADGAHDHLHF